MAIAGPAFAQRKIPLGLQLYTVRQDLAKDYDGTVKKVRDIGIRHVQANLTNERPDQPRSREKLYDSWASTGKASMPAATTCATRRKPPSMRPRRLGIKNITCSFPLYPADRAAFMAGPTVDDWKKKCRHVQQGRVRCARRRA